MTFRKYVLIWVWLAGLMLLGVALSYLPISVRTLVLLVLTLSAIKALLVAAYYMHLKFDARFLTLVAAIPIPLVIILIIALLLDKPLLRYSSRQPILPFPCSGVTLRRPTSASPAWKLGLIARARSPRQTTWRGTMPARPPRCRLRSPRSRGTVGCCWAALVAGSVA